MIEEQVVVEELIKHIQDTLVENQLNPPKVAFAVSNGELLFTSRDHESVNFFIKPRYNKRLKQVQFEVFAAVARKCVLFRAKEKPDILFYQVSSDDLYVVSNYNRGLCTQDDVVIQSLKTLPNLF